MLTESSSADGRTSDVGETCERGHSLTQNELMSSAGDFHVRTSVTRATEQGLPESAAAFGLSTRGSFARWDRVSLSWRTSQRCLIEEWVEFSETWPRAGSMRSGFALRRKSWEARREGVTDCFLWPTPRACSAMGATITPLAVGKCDEYFPNLETVAAQRYREQAIGTGITPEFCEWLMGFPVGWTDCDVLGMPSCRKLPSGSAGD